MQPQNMNFTSSVQINMKQVSYNLKALIALLGTTVIPIRHILNNTTHTLLLFRVFTIKYCILYQLLYNLYVLITLLETKVINTCADKFDTHLTI